MTMLWWLILIAALALVVPSIVLTIESFAARPPAPPEPGPPIDPTAPSLVVCVPAHDEERLVAASVRSLKAELGPRDRILVVAHNCTDRTAAVATEAGAEILDVRDGESGKAHALRAALAMLRDAPPDLIAVVDADSTVEPGAITTLRNAVAATGRPVQGRYVFEPRENSAFTANSRLALLVRNEIRLIGRHRLGMPVVLHGCGWVAPFDAVRDVPMSAVAMAEDFQFTIDLARNGVFVDAAPSAVFRTSMPATRRFATEQRTRWEHGQIHLMLTTAPALMLHGIRRLDRRAIGLALHLLVPPLALFTLLLTLVALAGALVWSRAEGPLAWLPFAVVAGTGGIALLALAGAIVRFTSVGTLLRAVLRLPLYIAVKLPIYLRFLVHRERTWVRTNRDPTT